MTRLKALWWDEYEAWRQRDLSARRYVYFWADGVYFSPRLEHDKQCLLVIVAADALGNKDIVGLMDSYRESAQSWREVLLDLKRRGLSRAPRGCAFVDFPPRWSQYSVIPSAGLLRAAAKTQPSLRPSNGLAFSGVSDSTDKIDEIAALVSSEITPYACFFADKMYAEALTGFAQRGTAAPLGAMTLASGQKLPAQVFGAQSEHVRDVGHGKLHG